MIGGLWLIEAETVPSTIRSRCRAPGRPLALKSERPLADLLQISQPRLQRLKSTRHSDTQRRRRSLIFTTSRLQMITTADACFRRALPADLLRGLPLLIATQRNHFSGSMKPS